MILRTITCLLAFAFISCGESPERKQARAEELRKESEQLTQQVLADVMAKGMQGQNVEADPEIKRKADRIRELFDEMNDLDPSMRNRFEQLDTYLKTEKGR